MRAFGVSKLVEVERNGSVLETPLDPKTHQVAESTECKLMINSKNISILGPSSLGQFEVTY